MPKRRQPSDLRSSAESLLPLRPVTFAVLTALADEARHGFAIMERVNDTVPRRPLLGPGTLYRLLQEMRRDGLVERVAAPAHEDGWDDERRSYHALTSLGRAAMVAEARRLERTLAAAGLLRPARGG